MHKQAHYHGSYVDMRVDRYEDTDMQIDRHHTDKHTHTHTHLYIYIYREREGERSHNERICMCVTLFDPYNMMTRMSDFQQLHNNLFSKPQFISKYKSHITYSVPNT